MDYCKIQRFKCEAGFPFMDDYKFIRFAKYALTKVLFYYYFQDLLDEFKK